MTTTPLKTPREIRISGRAVASTSIPLNIKKSLTYEVWLLVRLYIVLKESHHQFNPVHERISKIDRDHDTTEFVLTIDKQDFNRKGVQ